MREKLAIAITSFVSGQDVLSFLYHDESTKQQQQQKQTKTHLQYKENNIWKYNKRLRNTLNQLQLQRELSALPKSYLNEQWIWRDRGQQKMVNIKIWPEKQLLITYIHNIYVDIWMTDIHLYGWLSSLIQRRVIPKHFL